jgi:spermidine synthase
MTRQHAAHAEETRGGEDRGDPVAPQLPADRPVLIVAHPVPRAVPVGVLVALLVLSSAMLSFQILQVAVLGLQLFPEAAFLVVSLSMLGLGSGGSLAAVLTRRHAVAKPLAWMWWCAIGFSIGVITAMTATSRMHGLLGLILVNTGPYVFMGLFLALAFGTWREQANRTYFFDLVGAALGCVVVVLLLQGLADAGTVTLVLAGSGALAAVLLAATMKRAHVVAALALVIAAAALVPWRDALFPFGPQPEKFYGQLLGRASDGGHLERQKWNHLGRLDAVAPGPAIADFEYARQAKDLIDAGCEFRLLFSNGYNWTFTIDFKGRDTARQALFARWAQNTPYLFTHAPEVLNLGSGGGGDVYLAVLQGARRVTGVEINPLMIEATTKWYPDDWDGLWQRPEVELVELDARTYVGATDRTFDVITLNAVDTGATQMSLLSVNFLYTTQAFDEYLRILRPGGVIFLTRPREQLLRALTAATAALRARGVTDVARHVAVVGTGELLSAAVYADPLTKEQVDVIRERTAAGELGGGVQYLPETALPANLFTVYFAALEAGDEAAYIARSSLQLDPTTDDRPYFYHLERDFPRSHAGKLLIFILACVTSIGAVMLFAPLFGLRVPAKGTVVAGNVAYFGCIGVGFMLAEICLVNVLSLVLGHPAYSVAVTVASMLVFSGIGSMLAGWAADRGWRPIPAALGLVAACLALYALGIDHLASSRIEHLGARIALVVAFLAPASVFLGMPLPLKLRSLSSRGAALVPWAWAVNGFASVAGSVLAVMLAMTLGFHAVLWLAAGCYVLALVAHLATARDA